LVTSEPATRSMSGHWVAILPTLMLLRAIGSSGPYSRIACCSGDTSTPSGSGSSSVARQYRWSGRSAKRGAKR
jgi:hypothetical protein